MADRYSTTRGFAGMRVTGSLATMEILRAMVNLPRAELVKEPDGIKAKLIEGGLRVYVPFVYYIQQSLFLYHPAYDIVSFFIRVLHKEHKDWLPVPDQLISMHQTMRSWARMIADIDNAISRWLEMMSR